MAGGGERVHEGRAEAMPGAVLTVGEVLRRTVPYLAGRGVDAPRLDAELLLADVLGCARLGLYTDHDRPLTRPEIDAYRALIARRAAREPLAYIVGRRGFRRLDLVVSPAVLIPRPETELLVEWAIAVAPPGGRALDWGTGSGAVALALADERPDLEITAIDRSDAALAVARGNDPGGRVEWILSDGFAALGGRVFDLVVANPPYIAAPDAASLAPELAFEPEAALVAGPTGLEVLAAIVRDAPEHLVPGGWLISEIGSDQGDAVARLWRSEGFGQVEVRRDLAGLARAVGGVR